MLNDNWTLHVINIKGNKSSLYVNFSSALKQIADGLITQEFIHATLHKPILISPMNNDS